MIFAHFCTVILATLLSTQPLSFNSIGHSNAESSLYLIISMFVYPDLLAPEERGDGDEVARETADQEHHAAEEGGHQHPVRVVLTCIQSAGVMGELIA